MPGSLVGGRVSDRLRIRVYESVRDFTFGAEPLKLNLSVGTWATDGAPAVADSSGAPSRFELEVEDLASVFDKVANACLSLVVGKQCPTSGLDRVGRLVRL